MGDPISDFKVAPRPPPADGVGESSLVSLNRYLKVIKYVFFGFSIRRVILEIFDCSQIFSTPSIED